MVLSVWACVGAAVKSVCSEYRIHNADVTMRDDCDIDDLVDVIEGSRVYIPAVYVINKIDQVTLAFMPIVYTLSGDACQHDIATTPGLWLLSGARGF